MDLGLLASELLDSGDEGTKDESRDQKPAVKHENVEQPRAEAPIAEQLGSALLENKTAMWQHELLSALPDRQLDQLAKKDRFVRDVRKKTRSMESRSFPLKLHNMLSDADEEGFHDIVSWQAGGTSFKVHRPGEFANNIMGRYFRQTKFKSFQRQLNLYGFTRVHYGPNRGGYEHSFFVRDRPSLLDVVNRHKMESSEVSGNSVPKLLEALPESVAVNIFERQTSDMTSEMTTVNAELSTLELSDKAHDLADKIVNDVAMKTEGAQSVEAGAVLTNFLLNGDDSRMSRSHQRKRSEVFDDIEDDPVFRALLQDSFMAINDDDIVVGVGDEEDVDIMNTFNDNDRSSPSDFKCAATKPNVCASSLTLLAEEDASTSSNDENVAHATGRRSFKKSANVAHNFPWKLHSMLTNAKSEGFDDVVSWVMDGTAFCVKNQDVFVKKILPNYFDQRKFESFRRQLNLYGFSRIIRGPYRGSYMNNSFLRDEPSLCSTIVRNVAPRSKATIV